MTAILEIAAIIIAAVGVLWLVILWSRTYALDLKASSGYLDNYYYAAQKLTQASDTPASILMFIEYFATLAGHPKLARKFAWHMLMGNLGRRTTSESGEFSRELEKLKPESARAFANMVGYGMVASAAADPILSRVYLHMLYLMLSVSGRNDDEPSVERANTVAMDINRAQPAHAMAG